MKVHFYKHSLDRKDKAECMKVLDSLFLTTGEYVKEFEKKLADFTGNKFAVGVNSCTDALFLSMKYFNVRPGDEVITTPLSFIATANVIEHCGGTPIFVDVEKETGNIDANKIEAAITPNTRGISVVHLYGQLCDMKKISQIAKKHNLWVVEDCAHSLESERDGVKVGQLSDIACYSFYATKNLTSGEGGAITTNNPEIENWFRMARQHGMTKNAADRYSKKYEHYDMPILGYKTNMTNIQASLMINQIERVPKLLKKRERICKRYEKAFKRIPGVDFPRKRKSSIHARHLCTIWVDPQKRDYVMGQLQESEIGVAVNFRPIHFMQYYREKYPTLKGQFPNAERIGQSTITLPMYPKLTNQEQNFVIEQIERILQ